MKAYYFNTDERRVQIAWTLAKKGIGIKRVEHETDYPQGGVIYTDEPLIIKKKRGR